MLVHDRPTRDARTPYLPEPVSYRVKNKLLGPPLHTERLEHETLGKPTALAVFASDNLSSCAYATEEILRVLVPFVGLAAFIALTSPGSLRIRRDEIGLLLLYGVVGFALVTWLYFVAIERLPIGIGLLLEFTAPVLVAPVDWRASR